MFVVQVSECRCHYVNIILDRKKKTDNLFKCLIVIELQYKD